MTNKIIEAARSAGFRTGAITLTDTTIKPIPFIAPVSATDCKNELARFYALARAEALEDAAKVAEAQQDLAEQEKADKRFKAAMKDLETGKATERNAVDRGEHWMCVTTCNAVLRNAADAIRALKDQQHG